MPLPPPATEVKLWPNPASGEVRLALPNGMGQVVRQEALASGQTEHTLSVAGLPPGLYFWEVKSSNGRLGGGKLVVRE